MSYWGKDKKKKRQVFQDAQNGREISKNEIQDRSTDESVYIPKEKNPDINFNEDESTFTTFLIQTKALMWKNSLLIKRKSTFLPFLIMTPIVVGFLLDFIMVIGKVLTEDGVLNQKVELKDKLVKCREPFHYKIGDSPCLTVGYGIIGEDSNMFAPQYERYHDLMKIYARQNDFEYGKDIKPMTVGNSKLMDEYLTNNVNRTQFAVMFCHEQWREELEYTDVELPQLSAEEMQNMTLKQIADLSITKKETFQWQMPCRFDQSKDKKDMYAYYMIYNYTLGPDNMFTRLNRMMKYDDQLVILKTGIDNAILEQKSIETGLGYIPKIKQELQSYPYVPNRVLRDIDVVSMYGAFYLIMVPLTVFMLILDELVREKVDHLRKGMQLLGTLDSAYWASWILTGMLMNTIISIGMIIVGRFIYKFEVFLKTPWYVWFGMFFMNTQAYISLACFLSTLVTSKMQAFSVNFSVILTSFVECMVLSEPMMMKKVFFNLDTPLYMQRITKIFYLNPCFQVAKMFADITNTVSAHFDSESFNWIKSEEDFYWEDIWRIQEGKFVSEEKFMVPSLWDTGITLVIVSTLYFFLTFYFDSILPENRGVPQPWYFLISPFYWFPCCFSKTSQRNTANQDIERYLKELLGSDTNKTVPQELKRVSQEERGQKTDKFINGLRAINLSKSYRSITGTSNVQALRNVTFDIKKGELLGIMGHNGAGKSTLINVLCGLVYKDQGIARTFRLNIDDNLTQMRKRMGVVSQFDVLWDELTGIEHMHLFQILKRVEIKEFDRLVKERLGEVGLKDAGTLMVGKYSGGMRRRISVALSTMGDPDIILMDEPTTGMDPVSRRHVWQLVQKMKMDKAIIMSTHAMEEAELLSDKIIVLDNGELKCVGTPFQLKSSLGKGYRISMICGKADTSKVKKAVQKILPSSIYQEASGDSGGLVFDLPFSKIKELGPIFGLMSNAKDKKKSELADMVTDVGVSQTSLEEVFMAVTGHAQQ